MCFVYYRLYRVVADMSQILNEDDIRALMQNSGELGQVLDFVLSIITQEQSGEQKSDSAEWCVSSIIYIENGVSQA